MARSVLKICLGVCVVVIIAAIVILSLTLTIFKTRDPVISIDLVGLKQFPLSALASGSITNVSLATVITMGNPNHASFKYRDSKGYVNFHDSIIAEVPIGAALVQPRSTINVSTYADFMVSKLTHEKKFWSDVLDGVLNFTSTAELPGKAIALKFIKLKATAYSSCNISVNVTSMSVHSICVSKIKLS